jgi:hypothetical protein
MIALARIGLTDAGDDEFHDLKRMIQVVLSWRFSAGNGRPLMPGGAVRIVADDRSKICLFVETRWAVSASTRDKLGNSSRRRIRAADEQLAYVLGQLTAAFAALPRGQIACTCRRCPISTPS